MDVSLVLTHRCNLACNYCYAGEHHRTDIDPGVLERGVELLWSDDAPVAQLGFFGGEPFLAFDAMLRAATLARAEAARRGKRLLMQCTTNATRLGPREIAFVTETDMQIVVSIDGVEEAHDLTRRTAGGHSSFAQVQRGLTALVEAGADAEAIIVVTPETLRFLSRSVRWLWEEGIDRVRANLSMRADWTPEELDELRVELGLIAEALVERRRTDGNVMFQPFEPAIARAAPGMCGDFGRSRAQVVVGTRGHLYPCAPMVGEDRDSGPEAALRIGHLDDGKDAIVRRVRGEGAGCGSGKRCDCAAWLETGDRETTGPHARAFQAMCAEFGREVGDALAEGRQLTPSLAIAHAAIPEDERLRERPTRRRVLSGLLLSAGGLAMVSAAVPSLLRVVREKRAAAPQKCDAAAGGAELASEPDNGDDADEVEGDEVEGAGGPEDSAEEAMSSQASSTPAAASATSAEPALAKDQPLVIPNQPKKKRKKKKLDIDHGRTAGVMVLGDMG